MQLQDVRKPTCEYRENPLGIDVTSPRFSWQLKAPERYGVKQTAFQILVVSEEALLTEAEADLWDSGKVTSDQSMHITYEGKILSSKQFEP